LTQESGEQVVPIAEVPAASGEQDFALLYEDIYNRIILDACAVLINDITEETAGAQNATTDASTEVVDQAEATPEVDPEG